MKTTLLMVFLLAITSTTNAETGLEAAGDILQIALPVAALGLSYGWTDDDKKKSFKNVIPFVKSYGYGLLVVYAGKAAAAKRRPDGGDAKSFPSGHTYSAFSGAAQINKLLGPNYGIPAYTLASLVGYSRIKSQRHFLGDVLGGASIALLSHWYFSNNLTPESPQLNLEANSEPVAISIKAPITVAKKNKNKKVLQFSFFLGSSFARNTDFLDGSSNLFNLADFGSEQEQTLSSRFGINYAVSSHSDIELSIHPFERRNDHELTTPLAFNNTTFSSGEKIKSDWRQYDFDLSYLHSIYTKAPIEFRLGTSLYLYHSSLKISSVDGTKVVDNDFFGLLPLVKLELLFTGSSQTLKDWVHGVTIAGMSLAEQNLLQLEVFSNYRLNNNWKVGIHFGQYSRKIRLQSKGSFIVAGNLFESSRHTLIDLKLSYNFF